MSTGNPHRIEMAGPMTGEQLRAAAEDAYNNGAYRAAHRLTCAAMDAWADVTEEQLDWVADMMGRLEHVDPVLD